MSCEDKVEIISTINLYPIAVDSLGFDLFDLIFTEDAIVDFGGPAHMSNYRSAAIGWPQFEYPAPLTRVACGLSVR